MPQAAQKYFWDTKTSRLKPERHKVYIISRLLEFGDLPAVKWLLRNYSSKEIQGVLKKSRAISAKSAIFWANFFGIPHEEILCLNKHSQSQQKSHWKA